MIFCWRLSLGMALIKMKTLSQQMSRGSVHVAHFQVKIKKAVRTKYKMSATNDNKLIHNIACKNMEITQNWAFKR